MGSQGQIETPKFRVELSDYSVSIDEWRRAHDAPKSELPELNAAQKEVAGKFGISEERYARSVLAGRYGMRRLRTRAVRLGEEVERILRDISSESRVTRVVADMARERWVIVLRTPAGQVGIPVSREIGDDFLDFPTREATDGLKARVRFGLELGEKGNLPK